MQKQTKRGQIRKDLSAAYHGSGRSCALIAAAGTAGIFFGDIKTPDEYYKTPAVNSADAVTVTTK